MRKVLIYILGLFLITQSALPDSLMSPGLWEVSFKIRADGKIIVPAEQIKKSLARLTPDQQVEMLEALKARSGINEDGNIQICYSPSDLELSESTVSPLGDSCLSKVALNSPHKVIINFACINGFSGTSTRFIRGAHHYSGVTKVISPKGKTSEIIYQGRFDSPYCDKPENFEI